VGPDPRAVDDRAPTKGLYILTGSATPREDVNRHSGAGRIAVIQMRRSWTVTRSPPKTRD
jgi:hypothetical protein